MVEKGVVFGRFQIFHLKQMEYVLAAKMRCQKLYVGITHSDLTNFSATSPLDLNGVTKRDNPLTYRERSEMIEGALLDFGVKPEEFEIFPFPITHPDLILQYAPADATYFLSICSEWDEEKCRILQSVGIQPEILWRRDEEEAGIRGKEIRELIIEGKDWQEFVPKTVYDYMISHDLDQRIREYGYLE